MRQDAQTGEPWAAPDVVARRITVAGRVQGVGYRPFVYRTAHELGVTGWVLNGAGKVYIHAEGSAAGLDRLKTALIEAAPPLARPKLTASEKVPAEGIADFAIRASEAAADPEIHIPPDLFTCDECVAELRRPAERRYRYPFINCTQCGPRYTIIRAMPYDRPNTSMKDFPLCDPCRHEYESPLDRRFHAQPLACPDCGPALEFRQDGECLADSAAALAATADALRAGEIIAVKGVGGYHLMCDAANDGAVKRLRQRKQRPHKPLAVMFPVRGEDGLKAVREGANPTKEEAGEITDPARPIVLVRKREGCSLSPALAPGLAELGVFLPYSPLHHVLLSDFGGPVVATSGNISGEPVITDNAESGERLGRIADAFLHHNRPIVRPADDPVVRVIGGKARPLRLGRGIAPLEMDLPANPDAPIIALGGHMKDTVALAWDHRIVVSPHIGDLESPRSRDIFARVIADLQRLYGVEAARVTCDSHPGYASSRWAAAQGLPVVKVQHHRAHSSAIAGEHPDIERWLVFAWDGVGYGDDGTLWGGEAFAGAPGRWRRVASFRSFRLVGGDRAGREPWRSAAALMWEAGRDWMPDLQGAALAAQAWRSGTNVHETSAVGRLFDAAASLVLGRDIASFEGQGPMELEALSRNGADAIMLPTRIDGAGVLRSDWQPLLAVLTDDRLSPTERASIFHQSMAQALVDQTLELRNNNDFDAVGLTGGVFQNRILSECVVGKLARLGIDARLHEKVPANDGGLCFGQVIETVARPAGSAISH